MQSNNQKFKINFKFLAVVFCFFFLILSLASGASAQNASLYLSPSTGTYTVSNTFLVQVKVNSGGVAINAADGTLVFDPDKLEVVSISKTDSVFSLWIQEPTFSNSLGTINFAGGKPTPGFSGAAGIIINITFKARTAGTANLTFAAGSVLADDGKGTNILASMGAAAFTISSRTITPTEPLEPSVPAASAGVPEAPIISSDTHPEETKWYPNNNPKFSWKLPPDVIEVSYEIDQKPTTNPAFIADSLTTEASFSDLEDGIWYFHINFKNQYGWGKITHRKVLIDTEVPESFEVVIDNENDATNPTPTFLFKTTDSLSGIEYYEVIIEREDKTTTTTTPQNIKDNPYKPLALPPGKHSLQVKAFDKAGNYTLASTNFEISPIKGLEITKIPISIEIGETLTVEGKAEPGITVRIYIQKLEQEPILERAKADSGGKFVLSYDKALVKGDYLVWAQAEDERGALSDPTKKYSLEVGLPPFLKIGKIALDYLTTMITLIILIVGAVLVIFYTWYRISVWRKRVSKETKEVSQSVSGAFKALREEIEEQVSMLDRKPGLTKEEKAIRDKLQEALDVSEKFIGKEIRDVEKELE